MLGFLKKTLVTRMNASFLAERVGFEYPNLFALISLGFSKGKE